MPGTVVDTGKMMRLGMIVQGLNAVGAQLVLFTNAPGTAHDLVVSDLTYAMWSGYGPQYAHPFGAPALTLDFHAQSVGIPCVFANTSGSDQDYRGWALLNADTGEIMQAYQWPSNQTLPDGESLTLVPIMSETTEF